MTPDPFRPGVGAAVDGLRAVLGSTNSSFSDHIRKFAPELLPAKGFGVAGGQLADLAPHGTTIVALTFAGGVLIAGDRRATQGNLIAARDVEKVYITDVHSAAGIAGTAGVAIEMVRLFAVELEHYEKIEGVPLTFAGKASRLSAMVRDNLGAAMQGLAAVPLFVGYDLDAPDPAKAGRIVSYDVVGGRSEERFGYAAVGSGSLFARSALKKMYQAGMAEEQALAFAVEALYDAADDDSATGGPDLSRRIYPTAISITADGAVEVPTERLAEIARGVIAARSENDGGE